MAKYLYPITDEFVRVDGQLYPITHRFIKMNGQLYPITHKFVAGNEPPTPVDTDFSITVNSGADSSFILPTSGRLNNT